MHWTKIFKERSVNDKLKYGYDEDGMLSPAALALHTTIKIFRILSGDQRILNIQTVIDYVNNTECYPLSIIQTLSMFDIIS